MSRWMWWLLAPACLAAADDAVTRGAAVYRNSCAVTYCHGPEGKPGRAPGLGGRQFEAGAVMGIVAMGIPGTAMPPFGRQLKPEEIGAVAAYVVSLNAAGGAAEVRKPVTAAVPPDVEPGRALFFDATRTGACGSCHEVGGRGIPVSLGLQDPRTAKLDDLRAIENPAVVTARPAGEDPFPAVVVEKTARRVRVYDLSSPLPVLRSFAPADVELADGSTWRHTGPAALYTDAELASISRYLHWVAGR